MFRAGISSSRLGTFSPEPAFNLEMPPAVHGVGDETEFACRPCQDLAEPKVISAILRRFTGGDSQDRLLCEEHGTDGTGLYPARSFSPLEAPVTEPPIREEFEGRRLVAILYINPFLGLPKFIASIKYSKSLYHRYSRGDKVRSKMMLKGSPNIAFSMFPAPENYFYSI